MDGAAPLTRGRRGRGALGGGEGGGPPLVVRQLGVGVPEGLEQPREVRVPLLPRLDHLGQEVGGRAPGRGNSGVRS